MSYQSLNFILFTAVVLLLYYALGYKLQRWVLAAANITFFAVAGVKYIPFILSTTVVTYAAGAFMGRVYEQADAKLAVAADAAEKKAIRNGAKKKAKAILLGALFIAIGLLVYSKYTTFILENVNNILTRYNMAQIDMFNVIMPIGVSFYTFMALSYILDVYWKRYKAEKNFLTYAVYLSYFPHVVQGPIDRFNEFKEQVKDGVALNYDNLCQGAQLAIWGFFKKLVIADRLGYIVNTLIDGYENFDGVFIIIGIIVYSIQIYADFSGCIDIVTGVSEMFGIRLRKNFNHPYFSKTMPEFWRRWHISLQEWFKDYVYYPVSASALTKKVKKFFKNKNMKRMEDLFASCFPVFVVWMITGIWHGAAWRFVAWGMFHAALLIGGRIFDPVFEKLNKWLHIDTDNFGWHFWQMLRTFLLCCFGRIFFRAGRLQMAFDLIRKMFTECNFGKLFDARIDSFGLSAKNMNIAILSVAILWIVDMMQERMSIRKTLAKQNLVFRWVIILLGLLAVILYGMYGPGYNASNFIYEQF